MITVTLGVFMFTFVIVSLVGLLMVARRELVATGDVTITVNEEAAKALKTHADQPLQRPSPVAHRRGCSP